MLRAWIAFTAILTALSTAEFLVRRHVQSSFSTSDMYFYLDTEGNLPTWVSSVALLFAGLLAALVARARRSDGTRTAHWMCIAAALTFMSIDELCQYHEHLTEPLWGWLQSVHLTLGGYLRNAWVLPALLLLPLVALLFVPFLRALGGADRRRLALAAGVYLFGAVVMDMVSGQEYFRAGGFSTTLLWLVTIEEVFELLGTGLLLHALVVYLGALRPSVDFVPSGP